MKIWTIATFYCAILCAVAQAGSPEQNWLHFTRIGAYGLRSDNAAAIVKDAQASGVFGIEVDNDIPGRYESFLDPTEKLKAIRALVEQAHASGNKSFVYVAGTECITAHADKSQHSVLKDHPDWLQRKISGEPALFTSGAAFWIRPGDEDVWISPYAVEWRKTYMQRVRQIAATGIDGIYVDIPYWMTHFDGWENTWASFDEYTVNAFQSSTGLDARHDLKLGDFTDANFRKWVDFRISTLTDFVNEIGQTARSVNPSIAIIPEIYPGIEEEAVRVGADVYEMYGVVDAIAHEYEFGSGDHMASSRSQLDWFLYQAGMLSFRAFAQGKPTWVLNYSWDGDKDIPPSDAMKNLAMSQLMAGVNVWDAPGHSMAGSNDIRTRTQIFKWIAQHEKMFYSPRSPFNPVGVYFSPKSRNYDSTNFLPSYRGTLLLLLQKHLEIQVVTPRTIATFQGPILVLPNVSILGDEERSSLREFASKGGHLVITGTDATGFADTTGIVHFRECPAKSYFEHAQKDFAAASQIAPREFLASLDTKPQLTVAAPPTVATNIAVVNGKPTIFVANFTGLVPHKLAVPTPLTAVRISMPVADHRILHVLPFLGETQTVPGQRIGDRLVFKLPALERGAVAWFEDVESIH
jgi:endo-alpha-1,4-polygalactosaminidase (GH114 family)